MPITVSQTHDWRRWIRQTKDESVGARIMERASQEHAERERGDSLRLSSSGYCVRRMAYQHINFKAGKEVFPSEILQGRRVLVFHLGDLVEMSIKDWLLKEKGRILDLKTVERDRVSIVVDGVTIGGHPDALYQEDDGSLSVLDIKSIAAQGFDRVDEEGPSYENVCQIMSYMKALGLKRGRTLHYDKNASHIVCWTFNYSTDLMMEIEDRFRKVIHADPDRLPLPEYDALPEREWVRGIKQLGHALDGEADPDGKIIQERKQNGYWRLTGRQVLGFPCSYCPFKVSCYGELEVEVKDDNPVFYVPERGVA